MSAPIRLVIVDDHPIFREGLASLLSSDPAMSVVALGESADDALRLLAAHAPDLLLIDLEMPGDSIAAIEAIRASSPQTRVAVLTASADEQHVVAAFRAGVNGYILKGVSSRELVMILESIMAGRGYVPPSLGAGLISGLSRPAVSAPAPANPLDQLTEREREILLLVADGLSNKEIGFRLGLTEKTVKYYMSNILLKLQLRNRVEAALLVERLRDRGQI